VRIQITILGYAALVNNRIRIPFIYIYSGEAKNLS